MLTERVLLQVAAGLSTPTTCVLVHVCVGADAYFSRCPLRFLDGDGRRRRLLNTLSTPPPEHAEEKRRLSDELRVLGRLAEA